MSGLLSLLRSRKFWIAVVAIGQSVFLAVYPDRQALWLAIDAILVILIGAIAYEDAARLSETE